MSNSPDSSSTSETDRSKEKPAPLKRRAHHKSRSGCKTCKQLHIKCDEQGPPCANCRIRGRKCITHAYWPVRQSYPICQSQSKDEYNITQWSSAQLPLSTNYDMLQAATPVPAIDPFSSMAFRRLLELDLMHRWSSNTYLSMASITEEAAIMQHSLPRLAFAHDYLLNTILSFSALEIAMAPTLEATGPSRQDYVRASVQYLTKAVASFRPQLSAIAGDPTRHYHCVTFACFIAAINCGLAQYLLPDAGMDSAVPDARIRRIMFAFDQHYQCTVLIVKGLGLKGLLDTYPPLGIVLSYGVAPLSVLQPDIRDVYDRLTLVNESFFGMNGQLVTTDLVEYDAKKASDPAICYHRNKLAILTLMHYYAEEERGLIGIIFVSWPATTSQYFYEAILAGEPSALFVLMHWGVLQCRARSGRWWSFGVGKQLVKDVCDIICPMLQNGLVGDATMQRPWRDGIAWCRAEVGLEPAMWGDEVDMGLFDCLTESDAGILPVFDASVIPSSVAELQAGSSPVNV